MTNLIIDLEAQPDTVPMLIASLAGEVAEQAQRVRHDVHDPMIAMSALAGIRSATDMIESIIQGLMMAIEEPEDKGDDPLAGALPPGMYL